MSFNLLYPRLAIRASNRKHFAKVLTAAFSLLSFCSNMQAAAAKTRTWIGTSGDWNTASNWNSSPAGVPIAANGDPAVFDSTGSILTATLSAAGGAGVITFSGNSAQTIATAGFAFTLGDGTTGSITNSATAVQTISGAGALTLSGAATFTDNGTGAGQLLISTAISNGTNLLTLSGTGLLGTISGVIGNGSGAVTKTGTGTWTLSGANTYTGGTNINGGTLVISNASALGSSGTISFGGGTLKYNGITTDLSSRFSTAASQQYRIDTNSQNVTFASALTSSGATLAKSGGGTLTLSNTNTYSGATTLSAGILNVTGSIASSAVSVASGGTLAGSGTASGAVTLSSGGHISPGSSLVANSIGTLTLGSLTWTAGGIMDFNLGSTSASADKVSVTGAVTKSGSGTFSFDFGSSAAGVGQTYTVASAGSWIGWGAPNTDFSFTSSTITGGSFAFNGNNLEFAVTSAIPEPSTYAALAGLGALGLAMYRRRQTREASKLTVTASV
jgi:autotransporter-associated beta strand protein